MAKDKIQKIKASIVKAPRKTKKVKEPVSLAKVEVGDHLTVITDENGKKTMIWDWDKLSSHVSEATAEADKRFADEKAAAEKKALAKEKRRAKKEKKNEII